MRRFRVSACGKSNPTCNLDDNDIQEDRPMACILHYHNTLSSLQASAYRHGYIALEEYTSVSINTKADKIRHYTLKMAAINWGTQHRSRVASDHITGSRKRGTPHARLTGFARHRPTSRVCAAARRERCMAAAQKRTLVMSVSANWSQ